MERAIERLHARVFSRGLPATIDLHGTLMPGCRVLVEHGLEVMDPHGNVLANQTQIQVLKSQCPAVATTAVVSGDTLGRYRLGRRLSDDGYVATFLAHPETGEV